jgi:hypothetical protein
MTLFDHFVVLTFAGVYPAYGFFTYRNIKKDLIANKPGVRNVIIRRLSLGNGL